MESETLYQGKKARILHKLLQVSEQITDPVQSGKIFDYMTRTMAARPEFDLIKHGLKNQNIAD